MFFSHPGLIPPIVAKEALQIADPLRAVQLQGDRLDVLSLRVAQEPLQVKLEQFGRFDPSKGRAEQRDEFAQFLSDRFHIGYAQLALGRQLGFP